MLEINRHETDRICYWTRLRASSDLLGSAGPRRRQVAGWGTLNAATQLSFLTAQVFSASLGDESQEKQGLHLF